MPQEQPPSQGSAAPDAGSPDASGQAQESPRKKPESIVDRVKKLKLWMAWWGLVVLAIGLISFIMLAGWRARRLARHRVGPSRAGRDEWYSRPLAPPVSEDEQP